MKTLRFATITAALCFWMAALETAWARAGGGGGGSHGRGGWLNLIVLPIMLLYSAIITLKVREKSQACKELLARLEKQDPVWDLDAIRRRVSQVFSGQEAPRERGHKLAENGTSKTVFVNNKMKKKQKITEHRRSMVQEINKFDTESVD